MEKPAVAYNTIDWDNLNVKQYTALELAEIKRLSYYRYDPPNFHMLYLMLAMMGIIFSTMFYAIHAHWHYFNFPGEFPNYHKTGFWIVEFIAFFGGWAFMPFWWKMNKKSNIRWKEMQGIRKMIDDELTRRTGITEDNVITFKITSAWTIENLTDLKYNLNNAQDYENAYKVNTIIKQRTQP